MDVVLVPIEAMFVNNYVPKVKTLGLDVDK